MYSAATEAVAISECGQWQLRTITALSVNKKRAPTMMLRSIYLRSLFVSLLFLSSAAYDSSFPVTPVVGVLTQPRIRENNETEYYVAASYLKWLELAGARAIPVPYDSSNNTVDDIFSQVNGLLFPGGGSALPIAAKRLWQLALNANANGDYFPIWATCLGFEYVVMMASTQGESILQSDFDAENISLPLDLVNAHKSKLYADPMIHDIVVSQNVTLNNHVMGLEPSVFTRDRGLMEMFRITSINRDRNGRPFVSTIEPKNSTLHPFYGVQYHPEKNPFEYGARDGSIAFENINHSPKGILFSVHLAQFFGRMLQKASLQSQRHVYSCPDKYPLVYSYPLKRGLDFEQSFVVASAQYWEGDNGDSNNVKSKGTLRKVAALV